MATKIILLFFSLILTIIGFCALTYTITIQNICTANSSSQLSRDVNSDEEPKFSSSELTIYSTKSGNNIDTCIDYNPHKVTSMYICSILIILVGISFTSLGLWAIVQKYKTIKFPHNIIL